MTHNLYDNSLAQVAITSQTITTSPVVGSAVDTAVFNNMFRDIVFSIQSGTITDGTSYVATVQECDTSGGSYTDLDTWRVQGTVSFASSDDNVVKELGVRPTKRYVKLTITSTGASSGGVFAAIARLGSGSLHPVARS